MAVLSRTISRTLYRLDANIVMVLGLLFSVMLAVADYAIGPEISLVFFYVAPIAFVSWYAGLLRGTVLAVAAALLWYALGVGLPLEVTPVSVGLIDLATDLAFFLIVALLLARQRALLERERRASRTDFLTGVLNRRAFIELATAEIERARRHAHPFTITYLDLDNFKAVNDQLGHAAGDAALCRFADIAKRNLRATDSIARLGGDEFAFLLPETDGNAAKSVVEKIRDLVKEEMEAEQWPITLSVGVLTCEYPPHSVQAMLRAADQLMYQVKGAGKDAILYARCDQEMNLQAPHRAA